MAKPLDFQQYSFALANGETRTFQMLDFFALTGGAGVKVKPRGAGRFTPLDLYNIVGDDLSGPIGPMDFTNDTGQPVNVVVFTSSRRFSPTALSNTATVNAIVSGGAANGAPVAGNPTLVAGYDGTNARTLLTDAAGKLRTTSEASAVGGATRHRKRSAASTNATIVKASAGKLYGFTVSNTNAAARYLKLYDSAGAPVVGTDTPAATVLVPAGATIHGDIAVGEAYAAGIAYAMTVGEADSDVAAVGAGDLHLVLRYL